MEPAGFTVGVMGLAGLFSTCMQCFDYVQLGRAFGGDYGKCLLRLDAVKLRFSRWGEAVGIAIASQDRKPTVLSPQEFQLAQSLLQQIQDSFDDTEKISKRYRKHAEMESSTSGVLTVYNEQSDLRPQEKKLHSQLRAIAFRRQQSTSIAQKTRWALYEKKRFDSLIGDITDFVDKLISLFPVARESQTSICQAELRTITDEEDLVTLRAIARTDDEILQTGIEEELTRRGHVVTDWRAGDNADVWIGDENAFGIDSNGHHVSKFTVSGSAKVRSGNQNRGRSTDEA